MFSDCDVFLVLCTGPVSCVANVSYCWCCVLHQCHVLLACDVLMVLCIISMSCVANVWTCCWYCVLHQCHVLLTCDVWLDCVLVQ
jgi:hypothetical protein